MEKPAKVDPDREIDESPPLSPPVGLDPDRPEEDVTEEALTRDSVVPE